MSEMTGDRPVIRELKDYVRHDDDCHLIEGMWVNPTCTCGLDALLAAVSTGAQEPQEEIWKLARDIGTVIDVANRRKIFDTANEESDHRQMLRTLNEWRTRLHAIVASPAPGPARAETILQHRLDMAERAYDRLNLCPDHRDKTNGRCVVCMAEERTRRECTTHPPRSEPPQGDPR